VQSSIPDRPYWIKPMALVSIDSVISVLLQKLQKLDPPQGVELLSYKRNRSIAVLLLAGDTFRVLERGYREDERIIDKTGLPKHLKALIRSFPGAGKYGCIRLRRPRTLRSSGKNYDPRQK